MVRRRPRDEGFTVIELTIASSLLLIALVTFFAVLGTIQRSSAVQLSLGNATDQARLGFQELDRQLRSGFVAKSNPYPGTSAVIIYTEMANGGARCAAWALRDPGTGLGQLITQQWTPAAGVSQPSLSASGWRTVAGDFRLSGVPAAFSVISYPLPPATPTSQTVRIELWANVPERLTLLSKVGTSLTARNVPRMDEVVTLPGLPPTLRKNLC